MQNSTFTLVLVFEKLWKILVKLGIFLLGCFLGFIIHQYQVEMNEKESHDKGFEEGIKSCSAPSSW